MPQEWTLFLPLSHGNVVSMRDSAGVELYRWQPRYEVTLLNEAKKEEMLIAFCLLDDPVPFAQCDLEALLRISTGIEKKGHWTSYANAKLTEAHKQLLKEHQEHQGHHQ